MSCFTVEHTDSETAARSGLLRTGHGEVKTPVFMPVGTRGTVRGVTPEQLLEIGVSIILGNAFHLFVHPGMEIMREAGGLHAFMGWERPILTDSGGFQVFSLSDWRKITDEGVSFRSPFDGRRLFIGPKESIRIQEDIGSDIAMCFDECPALPAEKGTLEAAVRRTLSWARQCRDARRREGQLLFGIVQGGLDIGLRKQCLEDITEIGFDGYALGGLSVGESAEDMYRVLRAVGPEMPAESPRYLMGVGTPENILTAVSCGIDMFDCVMPTRNARNGMAFTRSGRMRILKSENRFREAPIDDKCNCYACRNFSLAYLRHLFKVKEFLGMILVTIHNLFFYRDLMDGIRRSISEGCFPDFREKILHSEEE